MKKPKTPAAADPAAAPRDVRFDLPGVKRIGDYAPRTTYRLPAAEAQRLVDTKGFTYCDTAPATAGPEEN